MSDPLFSVGLSGDSQAAAALSSFDVAAAMRVWAEEWGPKVTDAVKAAAPYAEDAGDARGEHLRDSIAFAGVKESSGGVSMSWTASVPWAPFVVEGTDEHEIHARVAKALHWAGPSGDQFAVSVDHPGTAPNPFPLTALEPLLPGMAASFAELFEEM